MPRVAERSLAADEQVRGLAHAAHQLSTSEDSVWSSFEGNLKLSGLPPNIALKPFKKLIVPKIVFQCE